MKKADTEAHDLPVEVVKLPPFFAHLCGISVLSVTHHWNLIFKGLRLTAGRRRTWVREFWVEAVGVARGVCGAWFR